MRDLKNNPVVAGTSIFALTKTEKTRLIKEYESNPVSSGRTQYLRYLHGEELTYRQGVLAKCAECCGGYADGRYDCGIPSCPLYQFMPYKGIQGHTSENEGGVDHE